jgi:hypothetical protein
MSPDPCSRESGIMDASREKGFAQHSLNVPVQGLAVEHFSALKKKLFMHLRVIL